MPRPRLLSSDPARRVKRLVDLVVAGSALVVLMPLLLGLSVSILVVMGRPVLFRQERIGQHERPFALYKFRSLTNATDPDGTLLPAAERMTRLGWFMRRWSLDELPQFYNVLRGDISLIGPRPLLPHYLEAYSERERQRHNVRPGITGLAQVTGRNSLTWDQKLNLDVEYVQRWSLALDARIAVRTVLLLVRPSSVTRDPQSEGDLVKVRRPLPIPHRPHDASST